MPGWSGKLLCCALLLAVFPATRAEPWNVAHFSTDAKTLYAEASAAAAPEGTDVMVLDDEKQYVFDAEGNAAFTEYVVYKTMTQGGAQNWSGVAELWEPWRQDRPRIRARVIEADGSAYELNPKDIADTPAGQQSADVYSDRRVLRAPLPAVAPGSVVEEEVVTNSRTLFPGAGIAARVYVGRPMPVQHTRVTVVAPASVSLRYKTQLLPEMQAQVSDSEGKRTWLFEQGQSAPFTPAEDDLPPDVPAYPAIDLSSTASWQAVADQYASIVDGRIAQADVGPLATRLTQGKQSRQERIESILAFLNTEIRYTGVEFAEAAIVPRTPAETLGSKYGDCKDKATLLVALLRAAGIPANLALLNSGARQDLRPDLPAADFFDHAIVYVPGDADLWIDATAQYARLGHLPGGDQGRYALVVRPGNNAPQRIPEASPEDNLLLEERSIELAEYGPAHVLEVSHPHGSFDSMYRDVYADSKNKDTLKNLAEYMKSQYLAEGLDRMDRSDPHKLTSEFELQLESSHARRGFTALDGAAAVIRYEGLFGALPKPLRVREDPDAKDADGKPAKKRSGDFYLRLPYATEWHYRITPPAGFQAQTLPRDATLTLGPAKLGESFQLDADGVVQARLRFDVVKRRMTAAEAREMAERIAALTEAEPIQILFEPTAAALLRQGKASDSFQSYRDLVSRYPRSAVQHLRRANALLAVGFGKAARDEARLAVKLDPQSDLAQATLAYILEYDLVGQRWHSGADFTGAAAAFRAAERLAPDKHEYPANLAVLLEYNSHGERYGPGADMKGAIAEYGKLTAAQLKDLDFQNNPAFVLFYSGRYAEARAAMESLNPRPEALSIACEAALDGAPTAIADAGKHSQDSARVRRNLVSAGEMLERMRQYPAAADLLEAGASGSGAVQTMNLATILRQARPHGAMRYDDSPEGALLHWLGSSIDGSLNAALVEELNSRNELAVENLLPDGYSGQARDEVDSARRTLANSDMSADTVLDSLPQAAAHQTEGNDETGYRVSYDVPVFGKLTYIVVRENGKYRLLTNVGDLTPVGLEVLDRVAANQPAGARQLLDWGREQQQLEAGDDPLEGEAFPRLWTRGQDADAARMTLAAASLLVNNPRTVARGVSVLEQASTHPGDAAARRAVDMALLDGYETEKNYPRLLELASRLAQEAPGSERAFRVKAFALRSLGRIDEVEALSQERLAHNPGDKAAIWWLSRAAISRGDYAAAYERLHRLVGLGKAGKSELNSLAWYSLFFDRAGGADVESAIKATGLAPHDGAVLHTLASAYAATGKTKEAYEILIQAMAARGLEEPNPDFWYVLGRLAEDYGERDIAIDAYGRVPAPQADTGTESSYWLVQKRLKLLKPGTI